jgi:PPM family protein phosphatase
VTAGRWGAVTDTGRVRQVNEDAVLAERPVWVVADGMGGHAAGEVASRIATDTLRAEVVGRSPTLTDVIHAVRSANDAIVAMAAEHPEMKGMGTTVTGLVLVDQNGQERIAVLNVGDSRTYAVREGQLHQITRDHSYVWNLVAAGELTKDQARVHPHRNIITRALGIEDEVDVETWDFAPHPGDRYLVCSDGLVDEVDDPTIADVLAGTDDPQQAALALAALANEFGGRDNITVLVVDVLDDGDPRAMTSGTTAGAAAADATAELPPTGTAHGEPLGGWLTPGDAPPDLGPLPPPSTPPADDLLAPATARHRRSLVPTLAFLGALAVVLAVAAIGIATLGGDESPASTTVAPTVVTTAAPATTAEPTTTTTAVPPTTTSVP